MADNLTLNAGTGGSTLAADDIGSIFYQRVKPSHGADGSATDTSTAAPLPTHPYPVTSGGESNSHLITAATDNAANVKASAGQVYRVNIFNKANYPVYLKFHNTAGTPTAGAGVVYTVGCQAGLARDIQFPMGLPFATGIGITVVKDIADAGTTAVAASDASIEIGYK